MASRARPAPRRTNLLQLDDALASAALLAPQFPHVSDCAAANLFLFRKAHDYRLIPGPLPHVSGRAYDGTGLVLPLFAIDEVSPEALANLMQPEDWLYPLSAAQVAELGDGWTANHDPGDSDYVYRRSSLLTLDGTRDRRRQAAQFVASGDVAFFPIETAQDLAEAQAVAAQWLAETGKPAPGTDYPNCTEALGLLRELELSGFIARRNGLPVGFLLTSAPWPDMTIVHFAKGLRSVPGVYPFMFAEFARQSQAHEWISFEQDLGNPRFRQAKRAFGPNHLIAKYRARPILR